MNGLGSVPQSRVDQGADWRSEMLKAASDASDSLQYYERGRNPALPNNFLDVSGAGFPADLIVIALQIPRQGVPQEMAQYRQVTQELKWLHVPWDYISQNGGADGKPNPPSAVRIDLGTGQAVAGLPGHYLLFASRKQYEDRRTKNIVQASERLAFKAHKEEEFDNGVRRSHLEDSKGPLTIDDLIEFEKEVGSEPSIIGRISG